MSKKAEIALTKLKRLFVIFTSSFLSDFYLACFLLRFFLHYCCDYLWQKQHVSLALTQRDLVFC